MTRTLAVRLDSAGDVLVTGPAVRALAATSERLTLLAGPLGADAAGLLPGVDEVLTWTAPWIAADPPPVDAASLDHLRDQVAARGIERAVVFTSFHQSALPTALLLCTAGVGWIGAVSEDYPGSLLDLRHPDPGDVPEPERALSLAVASGGALTDGDDGRLRLRTDAADTAAVHRLLPSDTVHDGYVVLHPGASVPARAWPAERCREAVGALAGAGHHVVVTGGPDEADLTAYVAGGAPTLPGPGTVTDLGGRTPLPVLAGLLAGARTVVVGNTGPAHLAAAVGTPVVSLFAPTVPAARWAPYGVPVRLLGDQTAGCRGSRARTCPVPGHPCLATVTADDVVAAVTALAPKVAPERSTA
jgi:ADP-heptose:LPS heptosyltransferase